VLLLELFPFAIELCGLISAGGAILTLFRMGTVASGAAGDSLNQRVLHAALFFLRLLPFL
jgi:hypothetical protein